jgi:pyruvate dehydrogenase E2 component (dihydrolipoamide acetyltransferase)
MTSDLTKFTMPKWGLTMTQGMVTKWLVDEGTEVEAGEEIVEIETEKIASAAESPVSGVVRRHVAQEGDYVPVSGLLAVIADADVADDVIDGFVESFLGSFVPEEEEDEGPAFQTINVAGRPLRYLQRGETQGDEASAPIVLIHGFGGDLNNWLFNHEALADGRAAYALDLPGHGGSSKDVGDGTLASLAASVAGFADGLGLSSLHLVGHSLGGAVAVELASSRPDLAGSVTVLAAAGLGDEINAGYVEGFIASDRRRALKPFLAQLFADPSLVTRQLVDDVLKFKRLDGVDTALRSVAAGMVVDGKQAVSLRDRLAGLATPVQVIWGTGDSIIPVSHTDGLPDGVAVHKIDGVGHMAMMEAASDVNRAIAGFIA